MPAVMSRSANVRYFKNEAKSDPGFARVGEKDACEFARDRYRTEEPSPLPLSPSDREREKIPAGVLPGVALLCR
jgi:hypothetical protein